MIPSVDGDLKGKLRIIVINVSNMPLDLERRNDPGPFINLLYPLELSTKLICLKLRKSLLDALEVINSGSIAQFDYMRKRAVLLD